MDKFEPAEIKPEIRFEEFAALDLRVGTIRSVDEVPDSKKLVKLTVDLGNETRTILSGMKGEREDPTEIVGRQAVFLVNLAPRKMAGEVSQGMLVDVGYADGLKPALAVTERPMPDGSRLG